jgi:hypothetical protein
MEKKERRDGVILGRKEKKGTDQFSLTSGMSGIFHVFGSMQQSDI